MSEDIFKGTTTVGIVCTDGIILATDSRATMGNMIASETAKKVYKVGERMAMTTAGTVGDNQQLVKYMSIEAKMYKVSREHSMSVKAAANQLANVLRGNRVYPYNVQILLGGYDLTGPSLYSIDMMGGLIQEYHFTSTGSGSPMAFGVLESQYVEGITCENALTFAVQSLKVAMKRDSASGSTIRAVIIDKEKFYEVEECEIDYIMNELI